MVHMYCKGNETNTTQSNDVNTVHIADVATVGVIFFFDTGNTFCERM